MARSLSTSCWAALLDLWQGKSSRQCPAWLRGFPRDCGLPRASPLVCMGLTEGVASTGWGKGGGLLRFTLQLQSYFSPAARAGSCPLRELGFRPVQEALHPLLARPDDVHLLGRDKAQQRQCPHSLVLVTLIPSGLSSPGAVTRRGTGPCHGHSHSLCTFGGWPSIFSS